MPQLIVAAAFLILLFAGGFVLSPGPQPGTPPVEHRPLAAGSIENAIQEIEERTSRLESAVEMRRTAWTPELRATFDRQMLYIDQSLAECRYGLLDKPNDGVYQELMLGAYREKTRLLEEFAEY
jgi:hypothetical protein